MKKITAINWEEGCKHLSKRDQVLRKLIKSIGPCTLQPQRRKFHGLARAIIYQQLAGSAAFAIMSRVLKTAKSEELTAEIVSKLSDSKLRAAGLSSMKVAYLKDLARAVNEGHILFDELDILDDELVVEKLISVKGIGRWTAEMYLIFELCKPDVMPVNDLAIKKSICELYKIEHNEFGTSIPTLSKQWQPYRSLACWYFWAHTRAQKTAKILAKQQKLKLNKS